jgi:hypothetical protein
VRVTSSMRRLPRGRWRVIGAGIHGVERRLGTYSDTLGLRHGIVMKRLLKNTMERYFVRVLILLYACMNVDVFSFAHEFARRFQKHDCGRPGSQI